jgi:hypothetical protein
VPPSNLDLANLERLGKTIYSEANLAADFK